LEHTSALEHLGTTCKIILAHVPGIKDSLPAVGCVGTYAGMSTTHAPCGHRWHASRPEVQTLPVLHVCNEPWDAHAEHAVVIDAGLGLTNAVVPVHVCACGASAVGPPVPQHGHAMPRRPPPRR